MKVSQRSDHISFGRKMAGTDDAHRPVTSAAAAAAFSAFAASEAATPPLDDEAGTLLYQWIAALPKVGLYKLNSVYPSIA